MAQNITIAGASYAGVPAVDIPKTGGGTARFVDSSDADAAAGDIAQGKTAYVGGEKITGTGQGGGASIFAAYDSDGTATEYAYLDYAVSGGTAAFSTQRSVT